MSSGGSGGVEGVQLNWFGAAVNNYMADLCANMAWLAAQDLARTAARDVPVSTGALRRSARVTMGALPSAPSVFAVSEAGGPRIDASLSDTTPLPPILRSANPRAFVSFNTPYAIVVHENTTAGGTAVKVGGSGKSAIRSQNYAADKPGNGSTSSVTATLKQTKYRQRRRNAGGGQHQAKWLERAVPRVQASWQRYLARALRRVGRVNVWRTSP